MPPAVIAAGVTAAASIGGAVLSNKSAKKATTAAANAQTQVAAQNNALGREIYSLNSGHMTPFIQGGQQAGTQINALLGGDESAFDRFRGGTNYQFRLNEGLRALNHGYAASGMLESGAAMRGITNYGQNMASGELNNYMNLLQGQQGVGMGAASALAGVGQNMVGMTSQNNQNAADATSNAALLRAQANNQMYGGFANALGGLAGSVGNMFGGSSYKK
jgi:hypothetical protein